MSRRHDADAGGDQALLAAKAEVRERTWEALREAGASRFPAFFLLDPDELDDTPRRASSIKGASQNARTVDVDELGSVDLVIVGCVAVSPDGARLGKGGGFSDLEFAVAAAAGLVGDGTVVATTVHETQVVDDGEIPVTDHDIRLDLIVTPERVIEVPGGRARDASIRWDELTDEKIASIPLLQRLRG